MKVRSILVKKGAAVETTRPGASVAVAATLLCRKQIGSLVVRDDDGAVVGVLDERNIIEGMSKHGRAVFDLPVKDLMRRKLVACTPEHDVKEVMNIMTTQRVRHVIVLADHELQGLVSIGDVVKSRSQEVELEINVLRDYALVHGAARL